MPRTRKSRIPESLLGALCALCAWAAPTAQADDVPQHAAPITRRGEHLARVVCSACHVVASDQEFPPLLIHPAPSFSDIANRPDTTQKSLRHFIMTTHWDETTIPMTMPNPLLPPEDVTAVTRYILSLRKPGAAK